MRRWDGYPPFLTLMQVAYELELVGKFLYDYTLVLAPNNPGAINISPIPRYFFEGDTCTEWVTVSHPSFARSNKMWL